MKFTIQSNNSDRELVFSNWNGDDFQAEIKGSQLNATMLVSAYTDANGLNAILQELGSLQRPWDGVKKWESIEENFSIAMRCNASGHVIFDIAMRIMQGAAEEATISAGLTTDFGIMSSIANDAQEFFG